MKVKDIMSPIVEYLTPEETMLQAVIKMRTTRRRDVPGVKGLVVLDEEGNLVGILSIKDVLRAAIPTYLDTKLSRFSWDGMLEEMARRMACRKVKEFMSADVITVSEDASLMACADLLIKKNMQRLPVLNRDKKIVGIVYIRDVFDVISQIFLDQAECRI
ncbi:MAG: CBS domain-containing protein [Desulfobulbaceae bacterium]|nr:CBS domain-containing protein [Desulfobulbaceae bacterium]